MHMTWISCAKIDENIQTLIKTVEKVFSEYQLKLNKRQDRNYGLRPQ